MYASLIIAIVIAVLTVVNVCLFAVICATRDKCKEYNLRCKNKAIICELYRNDCAKKSEILNSFLKKKKKKKENGEEHGMV